MSRFSWRASPIPPSTARSRARSPTCWASPTSPSGSSSCARPTRRSPRCPRTSSTSGAGGIEGVVVRGDLELDIVLAGPNPQILYWFAMPFTTPMPWEAVAYYDGKDGRPNFADHAVGTGPFRLAVYEKQHRFVLERNRSWYGTLQPEAKAPGADLPDRDRPRRHRRRPHRCRVRRPALAVPRPHQLLARTRRHPALQQVPAGLLRRRRHHQGELRRHHQGRPAVARDGRRAACASTRRWSRRIFYIGFNMDDPVVGAPAGERGRKLRQAMSLADRRRRIPRLFLNGRGVPAQSPLPPGIFGYDAELQEPVPPARPGARAAAAGRGRLQERHRSRPPTAAQADFRHRQHDRAGAAAVRVLRRGLARARPGRARSLATTYNQFQDKVRRGAYQIFLWGWVADFPDPENFLFLLECSNAQSKSSGPNTANFCNAEFDRLYREMKNLPNDEQRAGAHQADGGDPRARAALDRALPPRGLHAEPRLARQFQADGHLQSQPTSTRT